MTASSRPEALPLVPIPDSHVADQNRMPEHASLYARATGHAPRNATGSAGGPLFSSQARSRWPTSNPMSAHLAVLQSIQPFLDFVGRDVAEGNYAAVQVAKYFDRQSRDLCEFVIR